VKYQYHCSSSVLLAANPETAFKFLDDPIRLSSHMGKRSWMMVRSKMKMNFDKNNGKGVGAEIQLEGEMLGLRILVNETVTESVTAKAKTWETRGPQKLIVIDQNKMGFELTSENSSATLLRVFIDYTLPSHGGYRLLGSLLGHHYAKWCVQRMTRDAAVYFLNNRVSQ
jgi:hypothetical protein